MSVASSARQASGSKVHATSAHAAACAPPRSPVPDHPEEHVVSKDVRAGHDRHHARGDEQCQVDEKPAQVMAARAGKFGHQDRAPAMALHPVRVYRGGAGLAAQAPQGALLGDALGEMADDLVAPLGEPARRSAPARGLHNGLPLDIRTVHPAADARGSGVRFEIRILGRLGVELEALTPGGHQVDDHGSRLTEAGERE